MADVTQRDFVAVSPRDMLHTAFAKLQDCNCHTLPVVHDGQLVGVVTADNLAEVLMIQEALKELNIRNVAPDRASRRHPLGVPLNLAANR